MHRRFLTMPKCLHLLISTSQSYTGRERMKDPTYKWYHFPRAAVIGMALGNVPKPKLPTNGNPGKTDGKWKKEMRTHTARVVS